jgi:hypothetical protein
MWTIWNIELTRHFVLWFPSHRKKHSWEWASFNHSIFTSLWLNFFLLFLIVWIDNVTPDQVVKEIEDFSMPPLPKIDYTCNLYIYPQQTIFGKTSNIKVQMQVKVDDNLNSKPLPVLTTASFSSFKWFLGITFDLCRVQVIYNREKCGFVDTISCMLLVNKTSPCHFDELKIRLPPLTPRHHLFFTFLHLENLEKQVLNWELSKIQDRNETKSTLRSV